MRYHVIYSVFLTMTMMYLARGSGHIFSEDLSRRSPGKYQKEFINFIPEKVSRLRESKQLIHPSLDDGEIEAIFGQSRDSMNNSSLEDNHRRVKRSLGEKMDRPVWQVPESPEIASASRASFSQRRDSPIDVNEGRNEEIHVSKSSTPGDPYILDNYAPGQTLHFHAKFKRGFQLVPVSRNLYVLKEDDSAIKLNPVVDDSQLIVLPRQSVPSDDNYAINNDRTSAMLSFKAHMHHNVADIGNNFRRKVKDPRFVPNDFPDEAPNFPIDNNRYLQQKSILQDSNYLQNADDASSSFVSNPVLDDIKMYGGNNLLYNPNPKNQYLPQSYQDPSSFPYHDNNPADGQSAYESWRLPDTRNAIYRSPQNSWNDPASSSFGYMNNLERGTRDNSGEGVYRLKYLDRYAKALSLMNEDNANSISSDVQAKQIDDLQDQEEIPDSPSIDEPSNQAQESLSDIEKENSLNPRDISSLNDEQSIASNGIKAPSNWDTNAYEYPNPSYIPQRILNPQSSYSEETTVSSIVTEANSSLNELGDSGVKGKSFSNVIEPLTAQLQRLLSTIKLVNENLTSEQRSDETKTRRKRDHRDIDGTHHENNRQFVKEQVEETNSSEAKQKRNPGIMEFFEKTFGITQKDNRTVTKTTISIFETTSLDTETTETTEEAWSTNREEYSSETVTDSSVTEISNNQETTTISDTSTRRSGDTEENDESYRKPVTASPSTKIEEEMSTSLPKNSSWLTDRIASPQAKERINSVLASAFGSKTMKNSSEATFSPEPTIKRKPTTQPSLGSSKTVADIFRPVETKVKVNQDFFPTVSSVSDLQTIAVSLDPMENIGEKKLSINSTELEKTGQSGGQDFLVKLLVPEVIKNITKEGVIVRLPERSSSTKRVTASYQIVPQNRLPISDFQDEKKNELDSSEKSRTVEHQNYHIFSSNKEKSKIGQQYTMNSNPRSKSKAEEDAVIADNVDDTGSNARVDIRLKIPIHDSHERRKIVSRDSHDTKKNHKVKKSSEEESRKKFLIKRSEAYEENDEYSELDDYDADSSDDYLQALDEVCADYIETVLEPDETYEDEKPEEIFEDSAYEAETDGKNEAKISKLRNHIWPEHIGEASLPSLDSTISSLDSSTPLYQPPKRLQSQSRVINREYTKKSRTSTDGKKFAKKPAKFVKSGYIRRGRKLQSIDDYESELDDFNIDDDIAEELLLTPIEDITTIGYGPLLGFPISFDFSTTETPFDKDLTTLAADQRTAYHDILSMFDNNVTNGTEEIGNYGKSTIVDTITDTSKSETESSESTEETSESQSTTKLITSSEEIGASSSETETGGSVIKTSAFNEESSTEEKTLISSRTLTVERIEVTSEKSEELDETSPEEESTDSEATSFSSTSFEDIEVMTSTEETRSTGSMEISLAKDITEAETSSETIDSSVEENASTSLISSVETEKTTTEYIAGTTVKSTKINEAATIQASILPKVGKTTTSKDKKLKTTTVHPNSTANAIKTTTTGTTIGKIISNKISSKNVEKTTSKKIPETTKISDETTMSKLIAQTKISSPTTSTIASKNEDTEVTNESVKNTSEDSERRSEGETIDTSLLSSSVATEVPTSKLIEDTSLSTKKRFRTTKISEKTTEVVDEATDELTSTEESETSSSESFEESSTETLTTDAHSIPTSEKTTEVFSSTEVSESSPSESVKQMSTAETLKTSIFSTMETSEKTEGFLSTELSENSDSEVFERTTTEASTTYLVTEMSDEDTEEIDEVSEENLSSEISETLSSVSTEQTSKRTEEFLSTELSESATSGTHEQSTTKAFTTTEAYSSIGKTSEKTTEQTDELIEQFSSTKTLQTRKKTTEETGESTEEFSSTTTSETSEKTSEETDETTEESSSISTSQTNEETAEKTSESVAMFSSATISQTSEQTPEATSEGIEEFPSTIVSETFFKEIIETSTKMTTSEVTDEERISSEELELSSSESTSETVEQKIESEVTREEDETTSEVTQESKTLKTSIKISDEDTTELSELSSSEISSSLSDIEETSTEIESTESSQVSSEEYSTEGASETTSEIGDKTAEESTTRETTETIEISTEATDEKEIEAVSMTSPHPETDIPKQIKTDSSPQSTETTIRLKKPITKMLSKQMTETPKMSSSVETTLVEATTKIASTPQTTKVVTTTPKTGSTKKFTETSREDSESPGTTDFVKTSSLSPSTLKKTEMSTLKTTIAILTSARPEETTGTIEKNEETSEKIVSVEITTKSLAATLTSLKSSELTNQESIAITTSASKTVPISTQKATTLTVPETTLQSTKLTEAEKTSKETLVVETVTAPETTETVADVLLLTKSSTGATTSHTKSTIVAIPKETEITLIVTTVPEKFSSDFLSTLATTSSNLDENSEDASATEISTTIGTIAEDTEEAGSTERTTEFVYEATESTTEKEIETTESRIETTQPESTESDVEITESDAETTESNAETTEHAAETSEIDTATTGTTTEITGTVTANAEIETEVPEKTTAITVEKTKRPSSKYSTILTTEIVTDSIKLTTETITDLTSTEQTSEKTTDEENRTEIATKHEEKMESRTAEVSTEEIEETSSVPKMLIDETSQEPTTSTSEEVTKASTLELTTEVLESSSLSSDQSTDETEYKTESLESLTTESSLIELSSEGLITEIFDESTEFYTTATIPKIDVFSSKWTEFSIPAIVAEESSLAISSTEESSTESTTMQSLEIFTESTTTESIEISTESTTTESVEISTESTTTISPKTSIQSTTMQSQETSTESTTTQSPETSTELTTTQSPETSTESTTTQSTETSTETTTTESPETSTESTTTQSPETSTETTTESPETSTELTTLTTESFETSTEATTLEMISPTLESTREQYEITTDFLTTTQSTSLASTTTEISESSIAIISSTSELTSESTSTTATMTALTVLPETTLQLSDTSQTTEEFFSTSITLSTEQTAQSLHEMSTTVSTTTEEIVEITTPLLFETVPSELPETLTSTSLSPTTKFFEAPKATEEASTVPTQLTTQTSIISTTTESDLDEELELETVSQPEQETEIVITTESEAAKSFTETLDEDDEEAETEEMHLAGYDESTDEEEYEDQAEDSSPQGWIDYDESTETTKATTTKIVKVSQTPKITSPLSVTEESSTSTRSTVEFIKTTESISTEDIFTESATKPKTKFQEIFTSTTEPRNVTMPSTLTPQSTKFGVDFTGSKTDKATTTQGEIIVEITEETAMVHSSSSERLETLITDRATTVVEDYKDYHDTSTHAEFSAATTAGVQSTISAFDETEITFPSSRVFEEDSTTSEISLVTSVSGSESEETSTGLNTSKTLESSDETLGPEGEQPETSSLSSRLPGEEFSVSETSELSSTESSESPESSIGLSAIETLSTSEESSESEITHSETSSRSSRLPGEEFSVSKTSELSSTESSESPESSIGHTAMETLPTSEEMLGPGLTHSETPSLSSSIPGEEFSISEASEFTSTGSSESEESNIDSTTSETQSSSEQTLGSEETSPEKPSLSSSRPGEEFSISETSELSSTEMSADFTALETQSTKEESFGTSSGKESISLETSELTPTESLENEETTSGFTTSQIQLTTEESLESGWTETEPVFSSSGLTDEESSFFDTIESSTITELFEIPETSTIPSTSPSEFLTTVFETLSTGISQIQSVFSTASVDFFSTDTISDLTTSTRTETLTVIPEISSVTEDMSSSDFEFTDSEITETSEPETDISSKIIEKMTSEEETTAEKTTNEISREVTESLGIITAEDTLVTLPVETSVDQFTIEFETTEVTTHTTEESSIITVEEMTPSTTEVTTPTTLSTTSEHTTESSTVSTLSFSSTSTSDLETSVITVEEITPSTTEVTTSTTLSTTSEHTTESSTFSTLPSSSTSTSGLETSVITVEEITQTELPTTTTVSTIEDSTSESTTLSSTTITQGTFVIIETELDITPGVTSTTIGILEPTPEITSAKKPDEAEEEEAEYEIETETYTEEPEVTDYEGEYEEEVVEEPATKDWYSYEEGETEPWDTQKKEKSSKPTETTMEEIESSKTIGSTFSTFETSSQSESPSRSTSMEMTEETSQQTEESSSPIFSTSPSETLESEDTSEPTAKSSSDIFSSSFSTLFEKGEETSEESSSVIFTPSTGIFLKEDEEEETGDERTTELKTRSTEDYLLTTTPLPGLEDETTYLYEPKSPLHELTTEFDMVVTLPDFLERPEEEPLTPWEESTSLEPTETSVIDMFVSTNEWLALSTTESSTSQSEFEMKTSEITFSSQELGISTEARGETTSFESTFDRKSTNFKELDFASSLETTSSLAEEIGETGITSSNFETSTAISEFTRSEQLTDSISFDKEITKATDEKDRDSEAERGSTSEIEEGGRRIDHPEEKGSETSESELPTRKTTDQTEAETSKHESTETKKTAKTESEEFSKSHLTEKTTNAEVEEQESATLSSGKYSSTETTEETDEGEISSTQPDVKAKEEELLEKSELQAEKRKKLEERMKDLEKKEKELLEREAELEKKLRQWKEDKERRERERMKLDEERKKKKTTTFKTTQEPTTTIKITTTEPTTTIDTAKVQELEETQLKQQELEEDLKKMEEELINKEKELETKEKELEAKEAEHEREKEEFEKEWERQRQQDIDEKEKELEEKEKKLEEDEKRLREKETTLLSKTTVEIFAESSEPTPVPPVEETTISTRTTMKLTTKREVLTTGRTTTEHREFGHQKEKDEKQDKEVESDDDESDYVFDEDEEVWKEKQPEDYERQSEPPGYEEGCEPETQVTGIDYTTPSMRDFDSEEEEAERSLEKPSLESHENIDENLEEATKKVCLHVLQNDKLIADSRKQSKDFVTEVVCLPYNPEGNKKRSGRKLLDHEEESSIVVKKHENEEKKKINSLDLVNNEWLNDEATPALHTPKGFTRIYESWSEVPVKTVTFRGDDDSEEETTGASQDEHLKDQWFVDKSEKRVRPTEVGRLGEFEWTEGPTESRKNSDLEVSTVIETANDEENNENNEEEPTNMDNDRRRRDTEKKTIVISNNEDIPRDYQENCQLQQEINETRATGSKNSEATPQPPIETDDDEEIDEIFVKSDDNEDEGKDVESEEEATKSSDEDYGEIDYVTEEDLDAKKSEEYSDESYESSEDEEAEEDQSEPKWADYGDDETGAARKRAMIELQGLENERKMLKYKANELSKKLKMRKNIGSRDIVKKRKILESPEEIPESWPTEAHGRYHLGGRDSWVTAEDEDEDSYRRDKQSFTVNVLRLEYDDEEENHRMKCVPPNPEEMIIKLGLVTRSSENIEVLTEANEYDSGYEEDSGDYQRKKTNNEGPTEPINDEIPSTVRSSKKQEKERHPPGSEWPTERTTKFHVGGTLTWDKERLEPPNEARQIREAIINEDDDYNDEMYEDYRDKRDERRTTCYTVIIKSGRAKLRRNLEDYVKKLRKSKKSFEEPIENRRRDRRWRFIRKNYRTKGKKNSGDILRRDVLGRKLHNFFPASNDYKLRADPEPNRRSANSIDDENFYCDDEEDDFDYEDENRQAVRQVSDDFFTNAPDEFTGPTERETASTIFNDESAQLTTDRLIQQWGIGEAKPVTDFSTTNFQESTNYERKITDLKMDDRGNSDDDIYYDVVTESSAGNNSTSSENTSRTLEKITLLSSHQLTTIETPKNFNDLKHFFGEYADYGQDLKSGKNVYSSKSKDDIVRLEASRIRKEMQNVATKFFDPGTITKNASRQEGKILWYESETTPKKIVPIFVRLDDERFVELKNIREPPRGIYLLYKCGPPVLVGEYEKTEKTSTKLKEEKKIMMTTSERNFYTKQRFEDSSPSLQTLRQDGHVTDVSFVRKNNDEKLDIKIDAEGTTWDPEDGGPVPLCGGLVDNEFARSLTTNSAQTFDESSELFGMNKESIVTIPSSNYRVENSTSNSTLNFITNSKNLVRPTSSTERSKIKLKRKKILDYSNARKNTRATTKEKAKKRSGRSADTRKNKTNETETWEAEVDLDGKETTIAASGNEDKRNVPWYDYFSYSDDSLGWDGTRRSLLGLSRSSKIRNNKITKKKKNGKKFKEKLRELRETRRSDFRKSPALDSGVLEDDDNPIETSSLLDKVMNMINPKSDSLTETYEGMERDDRTKEEKPRSLLEKVKEIIGNAIGLGKKNKTADLSTEMKISRSTSPRYSGETMNHRKWEAPRLTTGQTQENVQKAIRKIHHVERIDHRHKPTKKSHPKAIKNERRKKIQTAKGSTTKRRKIIPKASTARKVTSKQSHKNSTKKMKATRKTTKHKNSKHNKIAKPRSNDKIVNKMPMGRKLVFKNEAKKLNVSAIIPKVRDIVEKQNLGNVERIIVYVDKNEAKRDLPDHGKAVAMKEPDIREKTNFHRQRDVAGLKDDADDYLLNEEESISEQLENGGLLFDGSSLDDIVSRVADEILKNAVDPEAEAGNLDPRIRVKVIQEVSNGTELPHEETRTEFLLDLSGDSIPNSLKPSKIKNPLASKNSLSSFRLTPKSSKRRMNLPKNRHKNSRRNWLNKIKRDEKNDEERSLAIIRRRLLRALKKKLKERRIRSLREKFRRRRSLDRRKNHVLHTKAKNKKIGSKITHHHNSDIDEKIRIIYAMHHKKKGKHSGKSNKSQEKSLKHREHGKKKMLHKLKNRLKRDNELSTGENLYDSIKKIVGRNIVELPVASFSSSEVPNFSRLNESTKNSSLSSKLSPNLDIGDAKAISSPRENISQKNNNFYSHMFELQKKLLKKSNAALNSTNERNSRCSHDCDDLCQKKYERVKNLVHAGTHYLLRRYENCENCATCVTKKTEKREDHSSKEVQNMAEKILNFASSIDSRRDKSNHVRETNKANLKGLVDEFGIDELGLTSEADRKSLAALVNEIIDVQKNVNETLAIIRNGIGKEKNKAVESTKKRRKSEKKITKSKSHKKGVKKAKHEKKDKKKKSGKNINKKNKKPKKVKKSVPSQKIDVKKSSLVTKKKLENHIDKVDDEIRKILTDENDSKPVFLNGSREIRSLRVNDEIAKRNFIQRYPRDMEDTNVASLGKYRSRRVRSSPYYRSEDIDVVALPNFLDLTNLSFDYSRNKKTKGSLANTSIPHVNPSATRGSTSRTKGRNKSKSSNRKEQKKSKKNRQGVKKKGVRQKFHNNVENLKKKKNTIITSTKNPLKTSRPLNLKLSGQVNFVEIAENRENEKQPSHLGVQRKLQSSSQILPKKRSNVNKSTRNKKEKTKKYSSKKKSRLSKKLKKNRRRESQTMVPMEDGRIRVKYIYKDSGKPDQHHLHGSTVKTLRSNGKLINFPEKQKTVLTRDSNVRNANLTKRENCICDVEESIEELKKILTLKGDSLSKINDYVCQNFHDIGDEIILVSSGIIGEVLPRSKRDLAEAKGMKYVKPGDLEDVLKDDNNGATSENNVMSFPGGDLSVPCNRDGEDITWLTSISKPNYTWSRNDGLPVSGIVQKNGNLELYDVDAKDTGNYTCFVSYIDPDNEELVENVYPHRVEVVTLPRYTLRGGNRYKLENCDENNLDVLASHLPKKLNDILCKGSVCDAFIYAPHCYHQQISIRTLIMPSSTGKLFPIGSSQCGLRCRKAVQDKVALLLSKNLRNVLRKSIVFRLPHRSRNKIVPIGETSNEFAGNRRRGRRNGNNDEIDGEVGLLVGCPAGYGLRDSHCLPCSPGFHSDNLGSRCKRCPAGTHQPNTGSRTCRDCTNPFVEGCYEMFWNSSSALMAILASLCAVLTILTILVWMLCCGKGSKNCRDDSCARSTEVELKYQQGVPERSVTRPIVERDFTDDEDRWCDCEKVKKKKKRFLRKKMLSRDEEEQEMLPRRPIEYRLRSVRDRADQKFDRVRTVPISCIDSYRSHGGGNHRNYSPKRYDYGKPPVPLPDFPR